MFSTKTLFFVERGSFSAPLFLLITLLIKFVDKYYEYCLKLLRSGGVITLDNVLWFGAVIDQKRNDSNTLAIRELNDFIFNDERVIPSMIPIGDGLTIAVKI